MIALYDVFQRHIEMESSHSALIVSHLPYSPFRNPKPSKLFHFAWIVLSVQFFCCTYILYMYALSLFVMAKLIGFFFLVSTSVGNFSCLSPFSLQLLSRDEIQPRSQSRNR
ncbi:hypothetical protein CC78DRAFT_61166 [Lojkania enalia]|uniref:Uncharacterized protein n=1 Tax=Lojkania enalia TaxID=147567 RepID=A0A9P4KF70_9PLEO|nr:hypothetical protein CC78DRAFT_61166 [Didymosphaeria enalia]